jgi:DNA-directed RNA polymerase subunit RPC12/RpoP
MADLKEYKCPCCGGAIAFDSDIQKMKCPYCDTEFEMETLRSYDDDLNSEGAEEYAWETAAGNEWREGEADGMRVYICQSCGGEIIGDETLAATKCPYCDNPVVMKGQFAGDLKPDYVIPFKLDKESAKEGLYNHLKGKRLLPKIFKDKAHIEEIKGIYVPFWLFDADANADARYRATRISSWADANFTYTKTSYFSVTRAGDMGFDRIPVDGSSKMADDLMESIEPFDFSDAVDFQTAYLAGYLADKYDVDADSSIARANARVRATTEQALASTVIGYSSVIPESVRVRLKNGSAKYALYPVWILNTVYEGKKYTFAMNGQTGKFVGDLPMDKGAYLKWLFGIFGSVGAAVLGVCYLLWQGGILK